MGNNPQLNMLKAEIRKNNPQLTKEEVHAEAVKAYNAKFPQAPITEEAEDNLGEQPATAVSEPNTQEVVPVKEDTITMTQEQLDQMMSTMEAKITSRIEKKFADKVTAPNNDSEIVDDYMEEPITFFCYSHQHSVHGYMLRGKEVLPPNGVIRFRHGAKYRKSIIGTSEYRDVQLCVANIRSRKEAEYLRKSPEFGITIHENINGGDNIKLFMADYLTKHQRVVSAMNHHAVIQRAQTMGVPVTDNIDDVRRAIIFKLAEADMVSYQKRYNSTASSGTELTPEVIGAAKMAPVNL